MFSPAAVSANLIDYEDVPNAAGIERGLHWAKAAERGARVQLAYCNPVVTRDGFLRLAIPGYAKSRYEITPWECGFDTCCIKNGFRIESHLWPIGLIGESDGPTLPADVIAFLDRIPAAIRNEVGRYEFGQPLLLKQLARSEAARDLFDNNPHLLWLAIVSVFESRLDADQLDAHFRMKQSRLLGRIARGAAGAQWRLLRRVRLQSGSIEEARTLVHALSEHYVCEAVAHESKVEAELLSMLAFNEVLATRKLVGLLAAKLDEDAEFLLADARILANTVRDIVRLGRTLSIAQPMKAIERCTSIEAIQALHDRWTERLNASWNSTLRQAAPAPFRPITRHGGGDVPYAAVAPFESEGRAERRFPEPPLPDSSAIKAIRTVADLVEEGFEQRHCVASYADAVCRGDSYIYKLLYPERATLELRKRNGRLSLGEFKGPCNRRPGADAFRVVRDWLAAASRLDGEPAK